MYPQISQISQIQIRKSSEFVGATRRVARTEFGVKNDQARFLILGIF